MKDKKEYLIDMYMFLTGASHEQASAKLEENLKADPGMTGALYRLIDQVAFDAVEDYKKQVTEP